MKTLKNSNDKAPKGGLGSDPQTTRYDPLRGKLCSIKTGKIHAKPLSHPAVHIMARLSEKQRLHILRLHDQGMGYTEVARAVGCSLGSAWAVVNKRNKHHTVQDLPRSGRPPKYQERDKRRFVRAVLQDPNTSAAREARLFVTADGGRIKERTARRILREYDLFPYCKRKRPILTKAHRAARLSWALEHQDWTVSKWRTVLFSDETKLNRVSSDGRVRVWCRKGEPFSEKRVAGTEHQGGGSLMMWSCMSWYGLGHCTAPEGTIDAQAYIKVLEENMLPSVPLCFKNKTFCFQHDGARPHTANATKAWLQKNKIKVLPWPAKSPDMNPIEHMWWKIKDIIRSHPVPPTKDALWEIALKAIDWCWSEEGVAYSQKLIDSMPRRVQALIDAKGGYTRY